MNIENYAKMLFLRRINEKLSLVFNHNICKITEIEKCIPYSRT